ncbi:hypothetical protein J5N97_001680 [Dioscorea zingiberensis]|uniref:Isopenicillin N synthase-like Fe(2+) 2OG dioxygenase domain-containing protein n=1 Tax=Dioscorea zingiberensis TaxID=325984 RepID=A0A9D5BTF7_9LILI|nr:hypothetical protein J5N97_001680 [Dioscorea zingiberensis]
MEALETQGFFEAVYDSVSMETLEELFGPVLKELFALPPDIKMRNHSDKPLQGYIPRSSAKGFNYESLKAWSNGRVKATPHRVKMLNNEKRYSIQLRSQFKDGCMIQAPEELVDQDHPQLYKPYNFADYLKFLFSDGGWAENTDNLKAYCGFEGEKKNDGMKP